MIQFNLLPDVKKEYIKTKRTKRLIMTASLAVSGLSLFVVLLLFSYVQVSQKGHIDNLTEDINTELNALRSTEDLNKVLTIQNQLTALPALHEGKPETSRLFTYLTQVTPAKATISSLTMNVANGTLSIAGRADSLATINQFADTLKFSTYKVASEPGDGVEPFTDVVTRLNRDNIGATYTIDLVFDPGIFDNTQDIVLVVPNIVSTRSTTGKPGEQLPQNQDVFDDTPEPTPEKERLRNGQAVWTQV